ncbi:MAG: LysR family transcriptional regulator substrate-binding protein, partial [Amphritea sp.]|nr:LysR family transcriptional regulator substrate-binding protein [Amphritea sp.]
SATEMLKLERDNRIDLALTTIQESPQASRRFQCSKSLFSEPYLVAMSRSHHLSRSKIVSITDLNNELFIGRSHCEHRLVIQNLIKQHNVQLNMAYITNQDDRALALVEADIGLTIVPAHYASSRIITIPLAEDRNQRSIGFEWGENENMNEITQFVDFASTASWAYNET